MANRPVPLPAPPPWRILLLLTTAVLLAHALMLLQSRPLRFGPEQEPPFPSVAALTTRRIEPAAVASPPPAVAMLAAPAAQKLAIRPVQPPTSKKKVPVVQEQKASSAIDLTATPDLPPLNSAGLPPQPPEADNAAPPATVPEAASAGALPAASAAAVAALPLPASTVPAPPLQTPVTAMALPASARLDYQMTGSAKGLTYQAQGELLWQHGGGHYTARMTVKALFVGSRTLGSTGTVSAQGLAPSRFSDKSRSELAAHFEPDKGRISFSANTPPAPWTPGAQDRLSVFLQLGGMLAGNPAGFAPGSTLSTLTAGPQTADYWTFVVEKEELLDLPFGQTATLKLSRQPRRDYDQKIELWYAPALGYLPVRSRITQANGDFVDQQLSELTRP